MSDYLTSEQIIKLLQGINPARVQKDGKGFSHVEAWEIRCQLNRIFGFGRWSEDVVEQEPVFETTEERVNKKTGEAYPAWTVCYRSLVRLTVNAPDGTTLATYTEGATGDASNQPSRADAHDLALKTSQSQALKRAAVNLGDQFGLSLYKHGSTAPIVHRTWVAMPEREVGGDSDETTELPRNKDGSVSRSRVSQEDLERTGNMTREQISEHNKLAKDTMATPQKAQRTTEADPEDPWYVGDAS